MARVKTYVDNIKGNSVFYDDGKKFRKTDFSCSKSGKYIVCFDFQECLPHSFTKDSVVEIEETDIKLIVKDKAAISRPDLINFEDINHGGKFEYYLNRYTKTLGNEAVNLGTGQIYSFGWYQKVKKVN